MWAVKTSGPYSAMVDDPDGTVVLPTSSNALAIRGKSAQHLRLAGNLNVGIRPEIGFSKHSGMPSVSRPAYGRSQLTVVSMVRPYASYRDYGWRVLTNDPLPEHPAPDNPSGKLVLLRHGETEWSKEGRHTGLTDVPLTARGEELARGAGRLVAGYDFSLVLSSPLQRAQRTAELAGLHAQVDSLLVEWDYGGYEGRTSRDIRSELGYNWSAFTHGVIRGRTPGETVEEVAARASRVLTRVLPAMAEGDVALIAHGHFLRILTAVFLRMAPRFAAQITLDAGSVSVLSFYREQPAILSWNYGLELPMVPSES